MSDKSTQFRLGDRCLVKSSKRVFAEEYVETGIPFFRSKDVIDKALGEFHHYDLFISEKRYIELKESHGSPKRGDVLISSVGNRSGQSYVVKDEGDFYFKDGNIIWLTDFIELDPSCLSYWLKSTDGQHALSSVMIGSAQKALTIDSLRNLSVDLPVFGDQVKIAAILRSLDDKIDLNRRMNRTLEGMARALFQSWFVDFDPVRAKLDGRPAALNAPTAALFPAAFQDSETGHIPKGWTLGKVGDIATLNRRTVNPGDFATETFDHYSLPAFDIGRSPKVELGSAIMSNKFTVTPMAVLLSKLNPHIPRIWLPDIHKSRRSVCSTEFMVASSKPSLSREYLFSLFTSAPFTSIYGTLVTGTTGSHQRIRPESVLNIKTIIPSAELIEAFTDISKPMFDRINRNTEQSRTLAALRDVLLPRLLSGELDVRKISQAGT